MHQKAKKILKKQRDLQLVSVISGGIGFVAFLLGKKFGSPVFTFIGISFCLGGGAVYLRTTCHIAAIKAYDMGNKDGAENRYVLIRKVEQADIEKGDYTD